MPSDWPMSDSDAKLGMLSGQYLPSVMNHRLAKRNHEEWIAGPDLCWST